MNGSLCRKLDKKMLLVEHRRPRGEPSGPRARQVIDRRDQEDQAENGDADLEDPHRELGRVRDPHSSENNQIWNVEVSASKDSGAVSGRSDSARA